MPPKDAAVKKNDVASPSSLPDIVQKGAECRKMWLTTPLFVESELGLLQARAHASLTLITHCACIRDDHYCALKAARREKYEQAAAVHRDVQRRFIMEMAEKSQSNFDNTFMWEEGKVMAARA